jgi:hypothetical protein
MISAVAYEPGGCGNYHVSLPQASQRSSQP